MIHLPKLPFAKNALEPIIKEQTIELHYGKHHQGYVNKLNELITGTEREQEDLETIITSAEKGPVFNNAAQIWNHTFYWNCLRPATENNVPTGLLLKKILEKRETLEKFQGIFSTSANTNFGSGRTRLVQETDGSLSIVNTSNAETPMTTDKKPLLTIDVWEHAYYLDYQNRRPEYTNNIRKIINRDFVLENMSA